MSRRRSDNSSISLFPFLAVLVCTMGALILLLITMTQKIRLQSLGRDLPVMPAEAPVEPVPYAEPEDEEEPPALAVDYSSLEAEFDEERQRRKAAWEQHLADARAVRDQARDQTDEHARQVAEAEKRVQALRAKHGELVQRLRAEESRKVKLASAEQSLKDKESQLGDHIALTKRNIEQLRRQTTTANKYAVVPYDGASGTLRRPIYIECSRSGLRILPEDEFLTERDLEDFTEGYNPLLAATQSLVRYWSDRRDAGKDEPEPYVLLLVRPRGAEAYYAARKLLTRLDCPFGYELIEEDWTLNLAKADPQAKEIAHEAIATTLASRDEVLAATSRSRPPRGNRRRLPDEVSAGNGGPGDDGDEPDDADTVMRGSGQGGARRPGGGGGGNGGGNGRGRGAGAGAGEDLRGPGYGGGENGHGNEGDAVAQAGGGGRRTGVPGGRSFGAGGGDGNTAGGKGTAPGGTGNATAGYAGTGLGGRGTDRGDGGWGSADPRTGPGGRGTGPGDGFGGLDGDGTGGLNETGEPGNGAGGYAAGGVQGGRGSGGPAGGSAAPRRYASIGLRDPDAVGDGDSQGGGGYAAQGQPGFQGGRGPGHSKRGAPGEGGESDDPEFDALLAGAEKTGKVVAGEEGDGQSGKPGAKGGGSAGAGGPTAGGNRNGGGGGASEEGGKGAGGNRAPRRLASNPNATPALRSLPQEGDREWRGPYVPGAEPGGSLNGSADEALDDETLSGRGSKSGSGRRSGSTKGGGKGNRGGQSRPGSGNFDETGDGGDSGQASSSRPTSFGRGARGGQSGAQSGGQAGNQSGSQSGGSPGGGGGAPSVSVSAGSHGAGGSNSGNNGNGRITKRWGYAHGHATIGLERKVEIHLLANRLLVGPNDSTIGVAEGETKDQLLNDVLQAIESQAKGWGKPPQNFYWIPTVKFVVYPGGNQHYERLNGPLRDWGVFSTVDYSVGEPPKPTFSGALKGEPRKKSLSGALE